MKVAEIASKKQMVFELAEPIEISIKRPNSALPLLPQPSAMFAGIEAEQRRS